ncbi:MAG: CPBP family intramembrane metalloprotease [Firmicutes bacterium]|jgi:membrane protease YdiL (CAAX protease family)|nr:CPBP family intramembrane metalloprotease [Bacillota bacterium]
MQKTVSSIVKKFWFLFYPMYGLLSSFIFINNVILRFFLYSITTALIFILLRKKSPEIFLNKQRPSFKNVVEIIIFSWLAKNLAALLAVVINIFFPVDLTISDNPFSLWEQFYLLFFVAPVVEEVYCRGIALHGLLPFGTSFAFIVSSLIFSLPHLENPMVIVNAFFAGFVYSYAAYKYGIKWSILLHALSNAFSFFLSYVSDHDELVFIIKNQRITVDSLISSTLLLLTILCFIYYTAKGIKNRAYIKEFWLQYRPNLNQLLAIFKNPWLIGFIIFQIIQLINQ